MRNRRAMTMFNITETARTISRDKPVEHIDLVIGLHVSACTSWGAIAISTRRAGYVDTLLVFSSSTPASHMASTAVRYPTPQRVDGSTQHTSVEVTDPLLCPPELDLVTRVSHPCICLCWGGIGASAPCLAAVPVVCDTTRLQLGSTTTQAVAASLFLFPTFSFSCAPVLLESCHAWPGWSFSCTSPRQPINKSGCIIGPYL